LLYYLNDKGKKTDIQCFFEGQIYNIHMVFVTFVIIFKFIFIYLLHVLFVLKIKVFFERKIKPKKCWKG